MIKYRHWNPCTFPGHGVLAFRKCLHIEKFNIIPIAYYLKFQLVGKAMWKKLNFLASMFLSFFPFYPALINIFLYHGMQFLFVFHWKLGLREGKLFFFFHCIYCVCCWIGISRYGTQQGKKDFRVSAWLSTVVQIVVSLFMMLTSWNHLIIWTIGVKNFLFR